MRYVLATVLACASSLALSSCLSGAIYTHTIAPLSTNFNRTPVIDDVAGKGDVKQIDYYVRVRWHANGIGEIAENNDFDVVHYADLETLRVLGIWTQQWVHVYGKRNTP